MRKKASETETMGPRMRIRRSRAARVFEDGRSFDDWDLTIVAPGGLKGALDDAELSEEEEGEEGQGEWELAAGS